MANSSKNPTFECLNSSDLYTVASSSQGNKALDYPIGLITADEVAYAGGVWRTNNTSYYLYTEENDYTMSPESFSATGSSAFVLNVDSDGALYSMYVYGPQCVRPVINLDAEVTLTGNGTVDLPYQVS